MKNYHVGWRIRSRWNRLVSALLLASAASFSIIAVGAGAAESERFILGKEGFFLYVKSNETPIYASPSTDAQVLHRLRKGREFGLEEILSPKAIDRVGTSSDQWIELKGYPNDFPHGWVRRRDFLSHVEFKRVERWPTKTYGELWGDDYLYYRFEPDGHTRNVSASDIKKKAKWADVGYVAVADGMMLVSVGPILGFYDEKNGIRCPDLLPGSACFTQEEIDAFLKAKAEGRQPPKITYDDGLPN